MYKLIKKFFETGVECNEKGKEAFESSLALHRIWEENAIDTKKINEEEKLKQDFAKFTHVYSLKETVKTLKSKKYKSADDKSELAKTLASLKFFEDADK